MALMDTKAPKVEDFEVCIDVFFVETLVLAVIADMFVGTLKDGYIHNVPLPRVPRIQSASLATLEPSRCIMAGHAPAILKKAPLLRSSTWTLFQRCSPMVAVHPNICS